MTRVVTTTDVREVCATVLSACPYDSRTGRSAWNRATRRILNHLMLKSGIRNDIRLAKRTRRFKVITEERHDGVVVRQSLTYRAKHPSDARLKAMSRIGWMKTLSVSEINPSIKESRK